MSDIDLNAVLSSKDRQAVDKLVRETDADEQLIAQLYQIERTQLERVASIHTYVPLLASRAVKLRLTEVKRQERIQGEVKPDDWLCI